MKLWPGQTSKRNFRGFLGFCSHYRRFIKSFADFASPFTEKEAVFDGSPECNEAFEELKRLLTIARGLANLILSGTFTLDTDASQRDWRRLSQEQIGKEKVIAYFSRSLNRRFVTLLCTRKKLMAAVNEKISLSLWTTIRPED